MYLPLCQGSLFSLDRKWDLPICSSFLSLILVFFCYSLTFDQLPPLTFIFSFLCRVFMTVVYMEKWLRLRRWREESLPAVCMVWIRMSVRSIKLLPYLGPSAAEHKSASLSSLFIYSTYIHLKVPKCEIFDLFIETNRSGIGGKLVYFEDWGWYADMLSAF